MKKTGIEQSVALVQAYGCPPRHRLPRPRREGAPPVPRTLHPAGDRHGRALLLQGPERPTFVWTTSAWLIHDYLASRPAAEVARLERAIGRGPVRWHALPFTTHSELMSPDLFRAGLSLSRELDRRFGVTTFVAKMTDVPGYTLGLVPLLAEAGVRLLHLWVNAASPPPDVPDLFRWRAPAARR